MNLAARAMPSAMLGECVLVVLVAARSAVVAETLATENTGPLDAG
jgi:hypothetical protein